nr:tripartite motif-containing protein 59-like [Procambarus clarkii]
MEKLEVKCTKCGHQFGDDRTPRNLLCGHTVCTSCVDLVIESDKKCPECDAIITASSSGDLPVGYTLLRMACLINRNQDKQHKEDASLEADCNHQTDAGMCMAHCARLFFRCQTCDVWVCRDCLAVDHPEPPRGLCRIVPFSIALKEVKEAYAKTTCSEKIMIDLLKDELNALKSHLSDKENENLKNINTINEKINYIKSKNNEITELLNKLESCADSIKSAENQVSQALTPQDMMNGTKCALECSESLKLLVTGVKKITKQFPPGVISGVSVTNLLHTDADIIQEMFSKHQLGEINGIKNALNKLKMNSPEAATASLTLPFSFKQPAFTGTNIKLKSDPFSFQHLGLSSNAKPSAEGGLFSFGNPVRSREVTKSKT